MGQYRQIPGASTDPTARAIKELYDHVFKLQEAQAETSKKLEVPAVEPLPTLQQQGLNLVLNRPLQISSGIGTPEGKVLGSIGDIYMRQDGGAGTTLYIKESGTSTRNGWTPK